MAFSDPIIGGAGTLIRQAIKSPDYVPGDSGWSINKDGSVEFANAKVRGELITGPHDAGLYHVTAFPTAGPGGATEGTGYVGPDPGTDGTPAHLWLTQAYPSVTVPASFQSWGELYASHGWRYEAPAHEFVGDLELNGDLFLPGGAGSDVWADTTLRLNTFSGSVQVVKAGAPVMTVANNRVTLHPGCRGIAYYGTGGTGTANDIGFKWSSPNFYARVDDVVSAVIGTVSDERLKLEVEPIGGALARLRALKPVTYLPAELETGEASGAARRPGLIAQDVEQVEGWAVPDVEQPGDLKTVDYLGFVPLLISALFELEEIYKQTEREGG